MKETLQAAQANGDDGGHILLLTLVLDRYKPLGFSNSNAGTAINEHAKMTVCVNGHRKIYAAFTD